MAVTTYAIRETDGYTGAVRDHSGTLEDLTRRFSHSLEMGKRNDSGIDTGPKTARSLAENLQKAAAANWTHKRYEFLGETKRVPYWDWKNCHAECATVKGSYDAKKRTIEIVLPDGIMESREKFSRREWEKLHGDDSYGYGWRLKGTEIKVGWVGSGVCASYYVEAEPPKTDKTYRVDGHVHYYYDPRLYIKIYTGYGPAARDKAIIKARELAATGNYASA